MKADLLDLILRRQAPAAEAVNEDLRAGSRHARELVGHLVGIIGQRIDLVLREGLREAVVAPIGGALILDDDRLLDGGKSQPQRGLVASLPEVVWGRKGAEAFRTRLHLIRTGVEGRELGHAPLVDRQGLLNPLRVDQRDLRDDQRSFGRVEHSDAQRRPRAGALDDLPAFAAVGSFHLR